MSYTLVPYLIDLEELRRVVGSKDEALLAAMIQDDPGTYSDEEADEGEVSLGRALRHLIMGEPPEASSAHQYGYALEQLCRHLGEALGSGWWESIHWDVIEATGMEEILAGTGPPVPLPKNDDFPAIGYLEAPAIAAMVTKLGDGHLKTAAPSGRKPRRTFRSWLVGQLMSRITRRSYPTAEELREPVEEYEGWLREAASKGKGLVFFYY